MVTFYLSPTQTNNVALSIYVRVWHTISRLKFNDALAHEPFQAVTHDPQPAAVAAKVKRCE
jgi:hypothetical protein